MSAINSGEEVGADSREQVAALVRAIRKAHQSPTGYGGLERFTVADIHEFARRLVAEGVRAPSEET